MQFAGGHRRDRFRNEESELSVEVQADWPVNIFSWAPGESALGRGARQPILNHLIYEAPQMRLPARQDVHWRIVMKVVDVHP